jgi:hypothetical protein
MEDWAHPAVLRSAPGENRQPLCDTKQRPRLEWPGRRCRPFPNRAPIEDTVTPVPASPIAPMPTRPAPFGHQIDQVRQANPE